MNPWAARLDRSSEFSARWAGTAVRRSADNGSRPDRRDACSALHCFPTESDPDLELRRGTSMEKEHAVSDAPKPKSYEVDSTPASAVSPGAPQPALFEAQLRDGVHVISFSRPDVLDAAYIQRLGDDIYHHLKDISSPRVVIDLDNVRFLSSAALSMLIALKTVVDKQNGKICIANVRDEILKVFKLTKLNKMLKIHDNTEKAIKSVQ
jgi:anti-anti-sigma factor